MVGQLRTPWLLLENVQSPPIALYVVQLGQPSVLTTMVKYGQFPRKGDQERTPMDREGPISDTHDYIYW